MTDRQNPFLDYTPPAKEPADPDKILNLKAVGEWFTLEVDQVGQLFEGNYGDNFPVAGKVLAAALDGRKPHVGDDAVWFVRATTTDGTEAYESQLLNAALKEAGVSSLQPGDVVSFGRIEDREPKKRGNKPFQVKAVKVQPKARDKAPF